VAIELEIRKFDVWSSESELEVSSLNQVMSDPRIGIPWILACVMPHTSRALIQNEPDWGKPKSIDVSAYRELATPCL